MIETIILASQSPRRCELLQQLNIKFSQIVSTADEDIITQSNHPNPKDFVLQKAIVKATPIAHKYPNHLVIGCDTIVVMGNELFEKTEDSEKAIYYMKAFRNKSHYVYSAIAIYYQNEIHTAIGEAEIHFGDYTDEDIDEYIKTDYWKDKAGAYGYQGLSAKFIEGINGDYYSVVGLPVYQLTKILKTLKVI
ncbi:Maf-like protein [Spironucleus salmonicida]|uniref:Maf-like protein n=1 Tax=Spironucleus salmonicida TaxID=348837 RepID=V6LYA3_9EUKA|nr:Maf-like protein [Spironucleus salmonicida]|eukprot:EST49213.1 Maf-like protein [Spironucleus salmonicida]